MNFIKDLMSAASFGEAISWGLISKIEASLENFTKDSSSSSSYPLKNFCKADFWAESIC